MQALEQAGTIDCEPIVRVTAVIPTDTIATVVPALARLGAAVEPPSLQGKLATIETVLPAAQTPNLQRQLAALTHGEGVLETSFAGYQPVSGDPPTRPRTDNNPLNREEYLLHVGRRL
jgi:ribosomal protection tetracycline resistance protein